MSTPTPEELTWLLIVLAVAWVVERTFQSMEARMEPVKERCLVHSSPLILCEGCVSENAQRMRRRLVKKLGVIVARHVAEELRSAALADIWAALEEEFPQ